MRKQLAFSVFALFFVFSFSAFAQTAKPTPPPAEEVIKVSSRLVVVPVSVLDSSGQPVLNLTTRDFRVMEENRMQEVEQVTDAEKVPLEIVLLFDISASTGSMFRFLAFNERFGTKDKFYKKVFPLFRRFL
jgi:hypothetical protein